MKKDEDSIAAFVPVPFLCADRARHESLCGQCARQWHEDQQDGYCQQ